MSGVQFRRFCDLPAFAVEVERAFVVAAVVEVVLAFVAVIELVAFAEPAKNTKCCLNTNI